MTDHVLRRAALVLGIAVLLVFGSSEARADGIQVFERNTNADLSFFTYDNLPDMVTGWGAANGHDSANGVWSTAWSLAGVSYDGTQYIQAFEKDANADLSIFTYATYEDMVTGWSAASGHHTAIGVWDPDWSMVGVAFDGSQYIQVFERNTNADLSFFTYDSFGDMVTGWSARSGHYAANGVWSTSWSMAGVGFDGSQYVQVFESNANADLSFFTYNTLADMVTGWSAASGHDTSIGVWSNDWSMTGVAFDPIPEPSTAILLSAACAAIALFRRHRSSR